MRMDYKKLNTDYSRYLGPDYKQEQGENLKASTIVSNHVTFFDVFPLHLCFEPSFCPKAAFADAPLIGDIFKAVDCVFIPRDGDKDARDKVVEFIGER